MSAKATQPAPRSSRTSSAVLVFFADCQLTLAPVSSARSGSSPIRRTRLPYALGAKTGVIFAHECRSGRRGSLLIILVIFAVVMLVRRNRVARRRDETRRTDTGASTVEPEPGIGRPCGAAASGEPGGRGAGAVPAKAAAAAAEATAWRRCRCAVSGRAKGKCSRWPCRPCQARRRR